MPGKDRHLESSTDKHRDKTVLHIRLWLQTISGIPYPPWKHVLTAITRPIYRDMPLAHHNPPNNQRNNDNLFHWALIRGPIQADIETAKNARHDK